MTSKNRVTVNFKKESFRILEDLARQYGPSLAGLTQRIVTAAIRDSMADQLYLENLRFSVAVTENDDKKKKEDIGRILKLTRRRDESSNTNILLRSRAMMLSDYRDNFSAPAFIDDRDAAEMFKEQARAHLKQHVINSIPAIVEQLGGSPDMLHLFVKKAAVRCDEIKAGLWSIIITPELHVLPVFNADLHKSKLDFCSIGYRNFKDVAVKGWDCQKYESLLLIDHATRSRSGGYFIGVSWADIDYIENGYENFHEIKENTPNYPIDLLCKIHIHNRDVNVKIFDAYGRRYANR